MEKALNIILIWLCGISLGICIAMWISPSDKTDLENTKTIVLHHDSELNVGAFSTLNANGYTIRLKDRDRFLKLYGDIIELCRK